MTNILLVEDSPEIQLLVKRTLSKTCQVTVVKTSREALDATRRVTFDLILLDVMLPDTDGFRLCAQLKNDDRTRLIPIIFLTSKSDLNDKLMGFSLGADDYVVKPFEPVELRARIEAKLNNMRDRKTNDELLELGCFRLSVPYQKAFLSENNDEKDMNLTTTEFKLLYFLIRNEGRILNREQILNAIWGHDKFVVDRTVDTHIYSLRKKMADKANCIESVPGAGYKLSIF